MLQKVCNQEHRTTALTGAWDEDPDHVRTWDAWLERCLSADTTTGTEQSRSVSGLD